MTNQSAPAPQEIYATFAGPINEIAVQKLLQGFGTAMGIGVKHVHLLFQTSGGNVGDGVCLYNFLRALPIDATLYNVGSVCSIGVIAYLGAKERKTSANATFMVHRTQSPLQSTTIAGLQAMTQGVALDDQRTEAILRQHVTLADDKWAVHKVADLWLSAQDAVDCGIATEVGEFSPPLGTQVFNVA